MSRVFAAEETALSRKVVIKVLPPETAAQLSDEGRRSEDGRTIFHRNANGWYAVDAPAAGMRPSGPPKLLFTGRYLQANASSDQARDGRYLMRQGATSEPKAQLVFSIISAYVPACLVE